MSFFNVEIIWKPRVAAPSPCIAVKIEGIRAETKEQAKEIAIAGMRASAENWQILRVQEL